MTASAASAAPTPAQVERQPRVVPIASTMVSASTNSTPEASVVAATTPTASPVTGQRLGCRSAARSTKDLTTTSPLCLDCGPQYQKRFRNDRPESDNPTARPPQRRVDRHGLPGPQRLRGRQSGHARADRPPRPGARLHARGGRPQPRHAALAPDRRLPRDRRGAPRSLQQPVLLRGPRRAQGRDRRRRLRPAALRQRAARQRLRRPLLPQARAPPQRRRRRAHGRRSRGGRGAPARALRPARASASTSSSRAPPPSS